MPERGPSTLSYADAFTRWGVVVEKTPAHFRIIIPPLPSIAYLHRGFLIGGTILLSMIVLTLLQMAITRDWSYLTGSAVYTIALIILVAVAYHRLCRRLVLQVDANDVTLLDIAGSSMQKHAWPRTEVSEIKLNRSNNQLLIWITGKDLFEIYATPDPSITEAIAALANEALHTSFESSDQPRSLRLPHRASPLVRKVLINTTLAMLALGLVMLFLGFPWVIFGYLLLFSGIPAGIALGTQPKEYYFF